MQKKTSSLINFLVAIIALLAGGGYLAYVYFQPIDSDQQNGGKLLEEARSAYRRGSFGEAEKLAVQAYQSDENLDEALIVAADSAGKQRKYQQALRYYDLVKQDGDEHAMNALCASGDLLRSMGVFGEAEKRFRTAINIDPESEIANRVLGNLLYVTGRRLEARDRLMMLLKHDVCTHFDLIGLGDVQLPVNERQQLQLALRTVPHDHLPRLSLGELAFVDGRLDEAKKQLQRLLDTGTAPVEAYVVLGKIYLEEGFPNGIVQWYQSLPENWQQNAETWFVIGAYYESAQEYPVAIRCYGETLRRDPGNLAATSRLSRLLRRRGDPLAEVFLTRSNLLSEFDGLIEKIGKRGPQFDDLRQMSLVCQALGRMWEAWGWARFAEKQYPDRVHLLPAIPTPDPQQGIRLVEVDADPMTRFDLVALPLPDWNNAPLIAGSPNHPAATQVSFHFPDIAERVGLKFTYDNGQPNQDDGLSIHQTEGGGIGILDYDLDGWPDVYFSQGGSHPTHPEANQPGDRLFRNLGNGKFEDVTEHAMLSDQRYSQGVTCADYNNDGFPDIFLCNFGQDRLFQNQGDGTFREVTLEAGIPPNFWSTSAVMADLNGDRLPDIYVATYVTQKEVFKPCHDPQGRPVSCHPKSLTADRDYVFLNLGDGRFQEVTEQMGFMAPDGRGLGVIFGDLENRGVMTLFVANDTTDNFYFEPVDDSKQVYQETALLKGISADADGLPQACMGVAVDDVDGNGLLDIFVTNFYRESNTFYHQVDPGIFADATRQFGLRTSSLATLGFGTQFVDGDLDTWPDLFVANGNIDNAEARGEPFRMRPQFYWNTGKGRFVEMGTDKLNPYFSNPHLGRAVALMDWNRDGKQDIVVLHLDRPISLLSNETETAGRHYFGLKLTATHTARDAPGTVVELKLKSRTVTKQLIAGGGYYVSNERAILAGIGDESVVPEVVVRWPSGKVEQFKDVQADQTYHLIEGTGELVPVRAAD